MADAPPRPRPAEYYNPRPLILGICFFWGVAMGFCLFYFAPPKQLQAPNSDRDTQAVAQPANQLSELERRRLDAPDIAPVAPAPDSNRTARPRLETMEIEPPPPALTTEGGLTGRTAHLLLPATPRSEPQNGGSLRPARRPPPGPPPIPELAP